MNSYEKFRKLMFEKKVNQADVIRGTGITRPTLCNWKNGTHQPTIKTLRKIAKYFGVPVSTFVDD